MTPLSQIIPLLQESPLSFSFVKAQEKCQEPPPNILQSSYKIQSMRRQERNFPGLLNSTAGCDMNEWDVIIIETEKGTNSSLAVVQPFGAMVSGGYKGRVLEGDWDDSCLVSALKFDATWLLATCVSCPSDNEISRKEMHAASRPETGVEAQAGNLCGYSLKQEARRTL